MSGPDEEFVLYGHEGAKLEAAWWGGSTMSVGASDGQDWGGGSFTADEARRFAAVLNNVADLMEGS